MRKLKFFVLFGIILSLGIASNVVSVSAVITSSSSYATADTYIVYGFSDNYGGQPDMSAGIEDSIDRYYFAYIKFDLSDIPSNFIKAEISLEFYHVSTTVYYNVNRVDASWDEFTLNGNDDCLDEFTGTKDGPHIANLTVPSDGRYKITVTDLIEGRSTLSISLEARGNTTLYRKFADIYSKDQAISNRKPKITWTVENNEIDPTIYAIIAGCVVLGVLGFAGAGFYIYKKKGSPPLRSSTEEQPFTTRRAKKSDKICWYCDNAIPKNFNVCPNCGAALE